jgi:hypothetical protein
LTEETWIKERGATVIDGDDAVDVTPASPQAPQIELSY